MMGTAEERTRGAGRLRSARGRDGIRQYPPEVIGDHEVHQPEGACCTADGTYHVVGTVIGHHQYVMVAGAAGA